MNTLRTKNLQSTLSLKNMNTISTTIPSTIYEKPMKLNSDQTSLQKLKIKLNIKVKIKHQNNKNSTNDIMG